MVRACNNKILRRSLLRATATRAGENDKPIMGLRSHYCFFALVDYVIAPSHYERSFGYAQDDKVGWGIIRMIMR
jgi:hypothetical protein